MRILLIVTSMLLSLGAFAQVKENIKQRSIIDAGTEPVKSTPNTPKKVRPAPKKTP